MIPSDKLRSVKIDPSWHFFSVVRLCAAQVGLAPHGQGVWKDRCPYIVQVLLVISGPFPPNKRNPSTDGGTPTQHTLSIADVQLMIDDDRPNGRT